MKSHNYADFNIGWPYVFGIKCIRCHFNLLAEEHANVTSLYVWHNNLPKDLIPAGGSENFFREFSLCTLSSIS